MFNNLLRRNRDPAVPGRTGNPITTTLNNQRHVARRNSNETLATLVNSVHPGEEEQEPDASRNVSGSDRRDTDDQSLFTMGSDETLINQVKIFNVPVSQFTVVRELPIISTFLQSGIEVFESKNAFETCRKHLGGDKHDDHESVGPMLSTSSSVMSIFKKQAPFMVIHGHGKYGEEAAHAGVEDTSGGNTSTNTRKRDVCKVYFRVVSNHVSYYTLRFAFDEPLEVILMNNNSHRPSVDFEYKGTKLRVVGVTGTTSTFGNGLLKVFVMKPSSELLSDGVAVGSSKKLVVDNPMFHTIETQDRRSIQQMMSSQEMLVNHPLATFIEEDVKVSNKFSRNGTIRLFGREELTEDSYVLLCVLLVLREQEYRKNKGYGRPVGVETKEKNVR